MKTALRHPKARGELTEIRFLLMAAACGLAVCKPWGDNQPFDFIVYCKRTRRSYRVQVKSCNRLHNGGFEICTKRSLGRSYSRYHTDFVVAYIVPRQTWYIIPVGVLKGRKAAYVYPHKQQPRGMYESYRDSWQLLSR